MGLMGRVSVHNPCAFILESGKGREAGPLPIRSRAVFSPSTRRAQRSFCHAAASWRTWRSLREGFSGRMPDPWGPATAGQAGALGSNGIDPHGDKKRRPLRGGVRFGRGPGYFRLAFLAAFLTGFLAATFLTTFLATFFTALTAFLTAFLALAAFFAGFLAGARAATSRTRSMG